MTWKPTDEMYRAMGGAIEAAGDPWNLSLDAFTAALIAVQPLIAEEAVEKFLAQDYSATVAALVDGAAAEARAKALEEAAAICEENAEDNADNARRQQQAIRDARDIRRLIPKPPEGT